MDITLILSIIGFAAAFIMLFYFAAKYREAVAAEGCMTPEPAGGAPHKSGATLGGITRSAVTALSGDRAVEMADIKESLRSLHYRIEEFKAVTEEREEAASARIAQIEQRLHTFEQEYMNTLQPTLKSLIEELEYLRPQNKE